MLQTQGTGFCDRGVWTPIIANVGNRLTTFEDTYITIAVCEHCNLVFCHKENNEGFGKLECK